MQTNIIPLRREVDEKNRWDLSLLYTNDEAWYGALDGYEHHIEKIAGFKGTLGDSAEALAAFLDCEHHLKLLEEQLGRYAELRQCEDEGDDAARAMTGRFIILAARSAAATAWSTSEIQAIANEKMAQFLTADRLADYRVYLHKLLRWKPHILSENEERLIALQSEAGGIVGEAFSVLTNVDFDFGQIDTPEGRLPLTQSTFSMFLERKDRSLRETAWRQFYGEFSAHKTTLAALYAGQVKQDVIHARIRGFGSAREAALFGDDVPLAVYDNLIATITKNLAPLHRYYGLRRRALKLQALSPWDMHTALVPCAEKITSWEEAVGMVIEALAPLGGEYTATLESGLRGRWADRYENRGKRSGAFSAGGFTAAPYILMNYKTDSIRDIFTLAHEAGHSMHSWYSARSNPFPHYSYTIFEAEVASTFNEELLFRSMLQKAGSRELRLYMLNKRIDDILATLYRQTMFAEYEKITHAVEEAGEALTLDILRGEYRTLLQKYFGENVALEEFSCLEGLRIPHFYRAFYVYKYATGISASLALARRVLEGGAAEKAAYFNFLKSGGSRFPIESLKLAGVDMSRPDPVDSACCLFGGLVDELERELGKC